MNDCSNAEWTLWFEHDDRTGHFEFMTRGGRREAIPMGGDLLGLRWRALARAALIGLALVLALNVGYVTPSFAAFGVGQGAMNSSAADVPTALAPPAQSTPIENSIFPALLQIALIVLVTEGIKSLARVIGGTNADGTTKIDISGKAAAYAYILVGVLVYAVQMFVLPNLPLGTAEQLEQFLGALAIIVGGSGLYSMTSALRLPR